MTAVYCEKLMIHECFRPGSVSRWNCDGRL